MKIAISILYLFLLSLTIMFGRYAKAGIGEKPLIYSSVVFNFLLSLGLVGWIIMTIVLVFYDWKLLLVLVGLEFILGSFILVPLTEMIIYSSFEFLIKITEKKGKKELKK